MELRFDDYDDIEVNELSALAYQKPNLYALSNRGYLYTFNIKLKKNKVSRLTLKKAVSLKKKNGKRLKKKHRDAEGMLLLDDELYISFERKPRVDVFSLNGRKLRKYKISKDLKYIENFQTLVDNYGYDKSRYVLLLDKEHTSEVFITYLNKNKFNYIDFGKKINKNPETIHDIFKKHWDIAKIGEISNNMFCIIFVQDFHLIVILNY